MIKNKMPSGKRYSRKKIIHLTKERFTLFDEAGIKSLDVGTRLYRHSPVGERCVGKCPNPNYTLNALTSLYDGVAYFNILDGPAISSTRFARIHPQQQTHHY
jgi:hypothetical protein